MKKIITLGMVGSMFLGGFIYKTLTNKHLNMNFSITGGINDETMKN